LKIWVENITQYTQYLVVVKYSGSVTSIICLTEVLQLGRQIGPSSCITY
jgi:hypothetical protein